MDFTKALRELQSELDTANVDFETRSIVDIRKAGNYRYAEDASTDLLCLAYAIGNGPVQVWRRGDPFPDDLRAHIEAGGAMRAWNAQFERVIWRMVAVPKYGWPTVRDDQWYCTAAEAAAMSLPRALEKAALVCKVEQQKDKAGSRAMMRLCKPKTIEADGTIVWNEDPKDFEALYPYCAQDVRAEQAMFRVTRRLTPKEREVYLLDQRMNDRGVFLDVPLIDAAQRLVDRVTSEAGVRLKELSNGVIEGPTKVAKIKEWLSLAEGVDTDSLAKKQMAVLFESELPPAAREVLTLRAEAGKESVKKLKAMKKVVSPNDDCARGLLLYHGAGTGRWTHKLIQPGNMPRGELAKYDNAENYIEDIMAGAYDRINLFAPPLVVVSACLRSMLRARPGCDLIAADYSGIEFRGVNWVAGQDDILDMVRKGDVAPKADKALYDPYIKMALAMGRTAKDRQAGKAAELGCGFQMGWKKFITAAWDVYQVRVNEEESRLAVKTYRDTHPKVVQSWEDANLCALEAVAAPGSVHRMGPGGCIKFTKRGSYLYIILPSGRPLCYAAPSIKERELPWSTPEKPAYGPAVHFWGEDQKTHKWVEMTLYGGLIIENIVQAVARDIMAEGKLALDKSGYSPILSVHDEVVSQVQKGWGTLAEFEAILRTPPEWAQGFPIMTEGWRGERYRK